MAGTLTAVLDTSVSPGQIAPGRGQSQTWRVISSGGGSGAFTVAKLLVVDPLSGHTDTINLPINTYSDAAFVRYSTAFDASGASITLTGLSALDPTDIYQTACGPVTGATINDEVDRLLLVQATGTPDAATVAGLLLLEQPEDLPGAVAATGMRNPYAAPSVIFDSNFMAGQTAMLRLMQLRDGAMGAAANKAADAKGAKATDVAAKGNAQNPYGAPLDGKTPDQGMRLWTRDYGFFENVDEQDCYACGYDAAIGSIMVGADWATDNGGIIGIFGGAGPGSIHQYGPYGGQQEDVAEGELGIYTSWVPGSGGLYVEGFLMGSYNGLDRTRTINTPTVDRTAESSNTAWTFSAGAELGLNLALDERTTLQPYGGIAWGQYWGDGYVEQGAGSLDMTVQSQTANEWQPTVGARLMKTYQSGRDVFTPFVGAAFMAQLPVGTWAPQWTSDFELGQTQQLGTAPIDRYGVNVQAGLEFASYKGITAYAAFDGAWLTDKQRYGGQIGVQVPF
jgi:outer membrane autotransporter protein